MPKSPEIDFELFKKQYDDLLKTGWLVELTDEEHERRKEENEKANVLRARMKYLNSEKESDCKACGDHFTHTGHPNRWYCSSCQRLNQYQRKKLKDQRLNEALIVI